MTQIADRTVLFADLRGSTGLFEQLGNAEATTVVTHCLASLRPVVQAHDGRVVKTLGDGLMALFASPAKAVQGAMKMHDVLDAEVLRGHERGASAGLRELRLQVTAARGEVVEMGGDAFGDAVNVAARLLDHAGDNETLVTADVLAELPQSMRRRFRDLDRLVLRGRAEPVHLYAASGRRAGDIPATQFGDMQHRVTDPDGLRLRWAELDRTFAAEQLPAVLGRSPQAAFCLDDSRVSRSHCRVDWHGGSFQLTDLSFNGTYVRFGDGEVVSLRRGSCALHGSGVIGLGGSPYDERAANVRFDVIRLDGAEASPHGGWMPTLP